MSQTQHEQWCDWWTVGGTCDCGFDPKHGLAIKMGDAYWKMLEETAKSVDTWPEWKKG